MCLFSGYIISIFSPLLSTDSIVYRVWTLHTWLFNFELPHTSSVCYICSAVCTCSPLCLPASLHGDLIWDSCCGGLSLGFLNKHSSAALGWGQGQGSNSGGPLRVSHPWGEVERRAPVQSDEPLKLFIRKTCFDLMSVWISHKEDGTVY